MCFRILWGRVCHGKRGGERREGGDGGGDEGGGTHLTFGVTELVYQYNRREMYERHQMRKVEDAAHNKLLQESAAASKARHEYLKANPAYADGRVW